MKICLAVLWSFHWKVLLFKFMDVATLNRYFFSSNLCVSERSRESSFLLHRTTKLKFFLAQETHTSMKAWRKKGTWKGMEVVFPKSNSTNKRTFLSIPRRFRSDMVEMYFEFFPLFLFNVCVSCAKKFKICQSV